jgi:hypothetical protein
MSVASSVTPPNAGVPAAVGGIAFALTPGQANGVEVLDYGTTDGIKQFRAATKSLYTSDDDLFLCNAEGLRDYVELLSHRATNYKWDTSTFDIPMDLTDILNGPYKNLLEHHGEVDLTQIREHAATYVDTQCRAAQDSMQAYECQMASMSREGRLKISVRKEDYIVNGVPSGACLFKVIIEESHIDTHATTAHIRTQLSSLDVYMLTIGSDIEKFNIHVKTLIEQLASRGEKTFDLLTNLFKGYKTAKDRKFVEYIEKKEETYEEGTDLLPEQLMRLASNKYKIRKLQNAWAAPTPEEEQITALQAQVDHLSKSKRPFPSKDAKPKPKHDFKGIKGKGKQQEGKGKRPDKEEWMLLKPADPSKSTFNKGKEYWWCETHQAFGRHTPSDCQGKGWKFNDSKKPMAKPKFGKATERMKLNKALAAIHIEAGDDSDE